MHVIVYHLKKTDESGLQCRKNLNLLRLYLVTAFTGHNRTVINHVNLLWNLEYLQKVIKKS